MDRRATLTKNPSDVSGMFDDVASRYDLVNDVLTAGQVRVGPSPRPSAPARA